MPRRGPRIHWLVLCGFLVVLLGELCLNGYVTHAGAEGGGGPVAASAADGVPDAVAKGGPVQRVDPAGEVTARSMPANTIALTFDDGPDPVWTPRILDLLKRYQVHATFFVIGSRVNQYPGLARRMADEGHELGVHTFTHVNLATTPPWQRSMEMALTANAIASATGRTPTLLRPPYSSTPDAVGGQEYAAMRQAGAAGYLVVLTDHDTDDWRKPGVKAIVSAATPPAEAGAVVMLHDSGGDRSQTLAALEVLIPRLQKEGYRFTTVSEGLTLPGAEPASTGQRLRGFAVRWAQWAGALLARTMTVLMTAAIFLGGLRLLIQVIAGRIHMRRVTRRLRYLGPVSVIVPAYNEAANIVATVLSLKASDYPQIEVIVVDDGSTDNTAELVERLRLPSVHVIRQEDAGKPAALNTGISYARGDILVLVDGDTVFEPDAIGRLIQPLVDPEVGAVSGNTKVANRRGLLGRWQHLEYVVGLNLDRRLLDVAGCMPTVPGAIGAFRRAAIVDIGGVSGQTLAEDTDLTMALIRAGWQVVYAPDAVAWTEAPATIRQLWRQRYRWSYGTMQAMWKHRRSLIEGGGSGRLGRRGLLYLLLFQILLPLSAPMVDVYAVYGALFLPPAKVALVWCGFTALQLVTAGYALRMDREPLRPLWSLPLQQIVYRQLMYLVVVQSAAMALAGGRLRWHRLHRTGAAAAVSGLASSGSPHRVPPTARSPVPFPPPQRPRRGGAEPWPDPRRSPGRIRHRGEP